MTELKQVTSSTARTTIDIKIEEQIRVQYLVIVKKFIEQTFVAYKSAKQIDKDS